MKILHLDDDPLDHELVKVLLQNECPECEIVTAANRTEFLAQLASEPFDVILADYTLPGFDGLEALSLAQDRTPDTPFVFFSGSIGEDRAIAAVRAGAADYVIKDRYQRLPMALRRAVLESRERRQHRATEHSLLAARERHHRFIEDARDAIFSLSDAGVITTLNPAFEAITGWKRSDWIGQHFIRLVDPPDVERARRRFSELMAGDQPGLFELRLRKPEGVAQVEFTVNRATTPDGTFELLGIGRDITEKKRLQEQFLRVQRMENLGMLAAGIAHDFNNILTPMLMVAQLLREQSTPRNKRLLDTLEQGASRGAALVKQILSFAQGGSDDLRIVQLKHVARDIAAMIEETFPRHLRFVQVIPRDLWPVRAQPSQMHQVLLNLCVNARDAMPDGGTLTLRLENRPLDAEAARALPGARPGSFLVVEVSDTGTGIAPDVLPRIWEPFFTTKGPERGTGLGLSTVRGIIAGHDGFCTVHSTVGQGTTFRIFLPAEISPDAEEGAGNSTTIPRGNGESILVIEDELDVRQIVEAVLSRNGYHVTVATDGAEAVALLAGPAAPADLRLIITDLMMPRLGGRELVELIRRTRPGLRVLVMSGLASGEPSGEPSGADAGDAFLLKPFRPETLLQQVHALLTHAPR